MRLFILCSIFIVLACTPSDTSNIPYDWGPSPWPEIRKERISSLLPNAMKASNVDAWLVICRENDNDPMADHIGGENAGGTAVFIFFMDENGFNSIVFSPITG